MPCNVYILVIHYSFNFGYITSLCHRYKIYLNFRKSLSIIEDSPPLIQYERDLMDAVSILDEFDVKIVPLKGRDLHNYLSS